MTALPTTLWWSSPVRCQGGTRQPKPSKSKQWRCGGELTYVGIAALSPQEPEVNEQQDIHGKMKCRVGRYLGPQVSPAIPKAGEQVVPLQDLVQEYPVEKPPIATPKTKQPICRRDLCVRGKLIPSVIRPTGSAIEAAHRAHHHFPDGALVPTALCFRLTSAPPARRCSAWLWQGRASVPSPWSARL